MKFFDFIDKYQTAIVGTLLIHVLLFVWLNVQSVSFYIIKPKEKILTTLDFSFEEKLDAENKETIDDHSESLSENNIKMVASNYDQNEPVDNKQKSSIEQEVINELKQFENNEFNNLSLDNPELIKTTNTNENIENETVQDVSKEKMIEASAKYFLKNRYTIRKKIPSYLCNNEGVVRLNVKVNQKGIITECSVNNEYSNTTNECLINSAINYVKKWKFNPDYNDSQKATGWIEFVYLSQ